ncbi:ATP-binding cassette domain-containing protein [Cellulomonas endophytica]|uniref:ATP-binding cassette domain-containing protein n=1 Tax=Cellulomonas endophytica TaxID=2494735 RepID=UPI001F0BA886|nr:ATP-binding cassette domain-containing protein [Cellulomonas endophytica]
MRRPPEPLRFALPSPRRAPTPVVLSVRGALVPGRLEVAALDLTADVALLVTGASGSGTSTLLNLLHLLHLLAGDLARARGRVDGARRVEVALLEQDVRLSADPRAPRGLSTAVTADRPDAPPLARLGLVGPADLDRPLRELSVGRRRRLVLALVVARSPHVLLLDEPTNHLSVGLAEELVDALDVAPAAVVVASHGRRLRRRRTGARAELVAGRPRGPLVAAARASPCRSSCQDPPPGGVGRSSSTGLGTPGRQELGESPPTRVRPQRGSVGPGRRGEPVRGGDRSVRAVTVRGRDGAGLRSRRAVDQGSWSRRIHRVSASAAVTDSPAERGRVQRRVPHRAQRQWGALSGPAPTRRHPWSTNGSSHTHHRRVGARS